MSQWNEIYRKQGTGYKFYNILQPHKDLGKVIALFKKAGAKRVLDLGCGAGRNLIPLAENGFDAYGIDQASDGLKIAKRELSRRNLKAKLAKGNVFTNLPYKDGFFDALISVQVMQHATPSRIKKGIAEMHRVLKPGGLAFITLTGRISSGKVHRMLILTARKIGDHLYIPQQGDEKGLVHFIYTKKLIYGHYSSFKILSLWIDEKGYYCFIARKD